MGFFLRFILFQIIFITGLKSLINIQKELSVKPCFIVTSVLIKRTTQHYIARMDLNN